MTRTSLIYAYRPVPEQLPPSKHKTNPIDTLDARIELYWNEDIRKLMQPVGHPQSKRFFIQQYQAAQLIREAASAKGDLAISELDIWPLMTRLRRVAQRRGIAPRQLFISSAKKAMAAE